MKRTLILLIAITCGNQLLAQSINYEITRDEPENHGNHHVHLSLLDLSGGDGNFSANIGLWGGYKIINNLVYADVDLRRSIVVFNILNDKTLADFNIGGSYMLLNTNKKRDRKFILKSSKSTVNTSRNGSVSVTKETYITIPYRKQRGYGIRGGLAYRTSGGDQKLDDGTVSGLGRVIYKNTQAGIYAGAVIRTRKNTVVKTDQYGYSENIKTVELFADILLLPISNNSEFNYSRNNDYYDFDNDFIKENEASAGVLGFRIGGKIHTEVGKDDISGKKLPAASKLEVGFRPYHGFYFNFGLGLTIVRG